jgi:hypothetical protein
MKKIILLAGVTGVLFAARYPISAEYNYMKGCVGNSPKMERYCACTLEAIEDKYTLEEFVKIIKDKNKFKDVVTYAIKKCIDKIDINEINK